MYILIWLKLVQEVYMYALILGWRSTFIFHKLWPNNLDPKEGHVGSHMDSVYNMPSIYTPRFFKPETICFT
jgi:hypothetical protein